jgi:hypothetical protein
MSKYINGSYRKVIERIDQIAKELIFLEIRASLSGYKTHLAD